MIAAIVAFGLLGLGLRVVPTVITGDLLAMAAVPADGVPVATASASPTPRTPTPSASRRPTPAPKPKATSEPAKVVEQVREWAS